MLLKDPGVLLKDPGFLLKDPGFLLKDPESFKRNPGVRRYPGTHAAPSGRTRLLHVAAAQLERL